MLSLSISSSAEIVLASSAGLAGLAAWLAHARAAALGFFLLLAAAAAGALEYSGLAGEAPAHEALTLVAAWLTFPLLAFDARRTTMVLAGLATLGLLLAEHSPLSYGTNGVAFVLLIIAAWRRGGYVLSAVSAGTALFVCASLGMSGADALNGFSRRDVYHAMLALATLLIATPHFAAAWAPRTRVQTVLR